MILIKILMIILFLLILQLQNRLWFEDGSIKQVQKYQQSLDFLNQGAQRKKQRNNSLYAEVLDLRQGTVAIEEMARFELGMVKKNETFFQILE